MRKRFLKPKNLTKEQQEQYEKEEDELKNDFKSKINQLVKDKFGNLLNREVNKLQLEAAPENLVVNSLENNPALLERAKNKILSQQDLRHLVRLCIKKNYAKIDELNNTKKAALEKEKILKQMNKS